MEMHYLIEISQIPKGNQFKNELIPSPEDIQNFKFLKEIKDDIVNFVNNGENLYLYSKYFGNGKTTWAIKLMQSYFNKIWIGNGFRQRGIFIHTPTFLTKCKEIINKKDEEFEILKQNLLTVDLVIWDDIAAGKLSDYDHSNLLTYIDQRKLNGKSNIYTGNLNEQELIEALGNRLKSRVWNDSTIVQLYGVDRREGI
jgi:DNA replication protein DnaC